MSKTSKNTIKSPDNNGEQVQGLPKKSGKGASKCVKCPLPVNGGAPENITPKKVTRNKNSKGSSKILEDLKKITTVTASVLLDKSKEILSGNGDFIADSFICYICLVHEPAHLLLHHLNLACHKSRETLTQVSKKDLKLKFCKRCRVLMTGFQYMIDQHFTTNFHKNSSKNNSEPEEPVNSSKKEYELVVKGFERFHWIYPESRKEFLYLIFYQFGEIMNIKISEFRGFIYFKDSWSVKEKLSKSIKVCGLNLSLQWREIEVTRFECERSIITELTSMKNLLSRIERLIEDQNTILYEKVKEKEARVCESLLNSLQKHYPETVCHVFGSRLTGLSFGGSDLDVYMDCGKFYYGNKKRQESKLQKVLTTVASCLRSSREFSNITVIERARVPLVNIKHIETGIICDISFKNGLAVENSALIKFLISIDKRTTPILLFVKYWMKKNCFFGRPCFSSYATVLLVLYYLAQYPNPVLPTVSDLRDLYEGPEKIIAGWHCSFLTNRNALPKTKNTYSVPQLLLGFFRFYEGFDFKENVISTFTGRPIARKNFKRLKPTGLPDPYRDLMDVTPPCYNECDTICVMDPFDFGHNTTKNFPKLTVRKFKYSCSLSAHLLSETFLGRKRNFLN